MTLKQQLISEVTKINTRLSYARNQLGKGEVVEIGFGRSTRPDLCFYIVAVKMNGARFVGIYLQGDLVASRNPYRLGIEFSLFQANLNYLCSWCL